MKTAVKPLPYKLRKNGFDYTKLQKGKRTYIFAQHVSPTVTRYEVFLIKHAKKRVVKGKVIPEHERFPGNEDFGIWAWCCWDLERAMEKFNELEGVQEEEIKVERIKEKRMEKICFIPEKFRIAEHIQKYPPRIIFRYVDRSLCGYI